MKKTPHVWSWFLTMGLLVTATVGIFIGNRFWTNVALGICWVTITIGILGSMVAAGSKEPSKEMRARLALTPRWRTITVQLIDIPLLIGLAGFGHWWTFGFFAIQSFLTLGVQQMAQREAEKSDEEKTTA